MPLKFHIFLIDSILQFNSGRSENISKKSIMNLLSNSISENCCSIWRKTQFFSLFPFTVFTKFLPFPRLHLQLVICMEQWLCCKRNKSSLTIHIFWSRKETLSRVSETSKLIDSGADNCQPLFISEYKPSLWYMEDWFYMILIAITSNLGPRSAKPIMRYSSDSLCLYCGAYAGVCLKTKVSGETELLACLWTVQQFNGIICFDKLQKIIRLQHSLHIKTLCSNAAFFQLIKCVVFLR